MTTVDHRAYRHIAVSFVREVAPVGPLVTQVESSPEADSCVRDECDRLVRRAVFLEFRESIPDRIRPFLAQDRRD